MKFLPTLVCLCVICFHFTWMDCEMGGAWPYSCYLLWIYPIYNQVRLDVKSFYFVGREVSDNRDSCVVVTKNAWSSEHSPF